MPTTSVYSNREERGNRGRLVAVAFACALAVLAGLLIASQMHVTFAVNTYGGGGGGSSGGGGTGNGGTAVGSVVILVTPNSTFQEENGAIPAVTLSAVWVGSYYPFTVYWYRGTSTSCSSDKTSAAANSNVTTDYASASTTPPKQGTFYYCAKVVDAQGNSATTSTPAELTVAPFGNVTTATYPNATAVPVGNSVLMYAAWAGEDNYPFTIHWFYSLIPNPQIGEWAGFECTNSSRIYIPASPNSITTVSSQNQEYAYTYLAAPNTAQFTDWYLCANVVNANGYSVTGPVGALFESCNAMTENYSVCN